MASKSTIREASRKAAQVIAPEDESLEGTDILDTLKKEHDEVKSLLTQLQNTDGSAERRSLVQKIKAALVPHTKAEEKVVYDAIISSAEEQTEVHGLEGYLEHEWASKTLQRLEGADPQSAEHVAAAKVLKELVEHHIKEEESTIWDDVREHFDAQDRAQMNVKFEAAKQKVKLSS